MPNDNLNLPAQTPDAQDEPAMETRERILTTAITEFAANGFSGARIDAIARGSKSNIRMIYHYFGSKEGLYIHVLEHVLGKLREDELSLDISNIGPVDGILSIFDFIDDHFSANPETLSLLSSENLNRARYLKRSTRIPEMSSPVIRLVSELLDRGVRTGEIRAGIEPLHLYVCMVSLAYFHKSNAYTLTYIFQHDLLDPEWRERHKEQSHRMLVSFLIPLA